MSGHLWAPFTLAGLCAGLQSTVSDTCHATPLRLIAVSQASATLAPRSGVDQKQLELKKGRPNVVMFVGLQARRPPPPLPPTSARAPCLERRSSQGTAFHVQLLLVQRPETVADCCCSDGEARSSCTDCACRIHWRLNHLLLSVERWPRIHWPIKQGVGRTVQGCGKTTTCMKYAHHLKKKVCMPAFTLVAHTSAAGNAQSCMSHPLSALLHSPASPRPLPDILSASARSTAGGMCLGPKLSRQVSLACCAGQRCRGIFAATCSSTR